MMITQLAAGYSPCIAANHLSPDEAFSEIGKLMTAWVALLPIRDTKHNNDIQGVLAKFGNRPAFDRSMADQRRVDMLRGSLRSVRSLALLKSAVPGVALVLSGSNKMDTGSAFMLIGTYADLTLSVDQAASDSLVRLTMMARPAPQASAALDVTTKSTTKPTAARRAHR